MQNQKTIPDLSSEIMEVIQQLCAFEPNKAEEKKFFALKVNQLNAVVFDQDMTNIEKKSALIGGLEELQQELAVKMGLKVIGQCKEYLPQTRLEQARKKIDELVDSTKPPRSIIEGINQVVKEVSKLAYLIRVQQQMNQFQNYITKEERKKLKQELTQIANSQTFVTDEIDKIISDAKNRKKLNRYSFMETDSKIKPSVAGVIGATSLRLTTSPKKK